MESKIKKILEFEGLVSPPFTAYDDTGNVNVDIIPKYAEYLSQNGITGVFVNGTTGDSLSLRFNERKLLAESWILESKKCMKMVIIQVGSNCVQETKELAQHAEKHNVDAISVLPPTYYKPTNNDDLISYLAEIASAAPNTPLIYYHIPGMSNVNVNLTSFVGEAQKIIPSFCGAKYTSTDIKDLVTCQAKYGKTFKILMGCEELFLAVLPFGINSTIGITNNMLASFSIGVLDHFKNGNMLKASKEQNKLNEIVQNLTTRANESKSIEPFFQVLRTAMNMFTPINVGNPRTPLYPLKKNSQKALEEKIKLYRLE